MIQFVLLFTTLEKNTNYSYNYIQTHKMKFKEYNKNTVFGNKRFEKYAFLT